MSCNKCNCDCFEKCSIVGFLPVGLCCESCFLYDEEHTCMKSSNKEEESLEKKYKKIKLVDASIEGQILRVVIKDQKEEEKTLYIDLKKYL